MNVNFSIRATPSVARRLFHISEICCIQLDEKIKEIAKQNLIPEDADPLFPLTGIRRAATQFILDCELRCAIPSLHEHIDRHLILNAILMFGIKKITIATSSGSKWKTTLAAFNFDKTQIITTYDAFQPEYQKNYRDGVLILDWSPLDSNEQVRIALAKEFPKTILFENFDSTKETIRRHEYCNSNLEIRGYNYRWWDMGICLFPEMPKAVFEYTQRAFEKSAIYQTTWKHKSRNSLAIFYNVFLPHFANMSGYNFA